ncbi:hypothetical protein OSB04_019472 [Centaurea solstitialis]|uniref:Uncharacterized protein n=1 Tax=Centaurea solstitialis TaxID=347529 RepID=A0AA38SQF0_9ASTR|nr:hypothetical protein OSB04_019472 [Centaurea solstitialis]
MFLDLDLNTDLDSDLDLNRDLNLESDMNTDPNLILWLHQLLESLRRSDPEFSLISHLRPPIPHYSPTQIDSSFSLNRTALIPFKKIFGFLLSLLFVLGDHPSRIGTVNHLVPASRPLLVVPTRDLEIVPKARPRKLKTVMPKLAPPTPTKKE